MKTIKQILNKNKINFKTMTPARVAFLGLYLAIMITMKYVLGFVPGIELITFMFIIAGIFFPITDGLFLVVSFNIMIMVMYGWGTWQIMYWVIWPFDLITSKLLSKVTKNKYIFAFWGFVCGFLVAFWYFISDTAVFGFSFALVNIISAIPINLIEGFTTTIVILTCADGISSVMKLNSERLWGNNKQFVFKKDNFKYSWLFVVILNVIFAIGIILLFVYNSEFLSLKESMTAHTKATKI